MEYISVCEKMLNPLEVREMQIDRHVFFFFLFFASQLDKNSKACHYP